MSSEAELKLARAKSQMIMRFPFFAIVAMRLDFVKVEDNHWLAKGGMPATMATDGYRIYWWEEFVEALTVPQLMFVIAHEVLHVVFFHMTRRGDRDPKIWNIACDYAINIIATEAGLEMPDGERRGWLDMKYKDWSAYAIYDELMKNAIKVSFSMPGDGDGEGQGQGDPKDGKGGGMWGMVIDARNPDGTSVSEHERNQIEEEIKQAVQAAAEVAKKRGNVPGGLEGVLAAAQKNRINWKDYIQNWVKGNVPDDYSWRRPNRKWMVNHGIYMPRMELHGAGNGVLSIDTSGSVSDEELVRYISEIVGVIEMCKPDKLTIIQHDAVIQKIDVWEYGMDFKTLKIKGRGGTCIMPSFNFVNGKLKFHGETMDDPVDWMICFTDMEIGDWPAGKDIPDFPVLWCATGDDRAGFGTYIDLRGDGL
jgi:predicted metal-dependent peptidase